MDVDDELLIPCDNEVEEAQFWKARSQEISVNFARLGITLIVLGVLATVMGAASLSAATDYLDLVGEGIWCGISIIICGGLCIASRYSLHFELVMANFIMNIISSVLLMFGIIFSAASTYQYNNKNWVENYILFALGVNIWLCACFPICIYLSIVNYKILKQNKKNFCDCECFSKISSVGPSGYTSVYVPVRTYCMDAPSIEEN